MLQKVATLMLRVVFIMSFSKERPKTEHGDIKISVKDSGPGIADDQLKHLFDRYYRTNRSVQKFSGLGLGLYISSDIIKNHCGTIGIDCTAGQGSEFWFTIPNSENYHK